MRHREVLTPEQERELDALDRALAGAAVDADLIELEELVRDVRATAPQMSPAFAARLEHEVSEGFPSSPAARRRPAWLRWPQGWAQLPAVGVLAAALIALVVVIDGATSGTDRSASGIAVAPETTLTDPASNAATGEPPAAATSTDSAGAPAPSSSTADLDAAARSSKAVDEQSRESSGAATGGGASAPPAAAAAPQTAAQANRKVERSAVLVLVAPDDEFQSTTDAVVRTADRFGGIVASSNSSSSDSRGSEAIYDLRIPTQRLDEALAALSKLGHVAERSQNLQDITGAFYGTQERLSEARAERRGLLRALGRASTQEQIDRLRARLRFVRGQINTLERQMSSLRRRADLATVHVTVRGGGTSEDGAGGDPWTPGDAAGDAVRVLEVIAGVALISLAILVPLALLGAAIAFGVRIGRRHGRERALEAS